MKNHSRCEVNRQEENPEAKLKIMEWAELEAAK
jgi:hypothetical protein